MYFILYKFFQTKNFSEVNLRAAVWLLEESGVRTDRWLKRLHWSEFDKSKQKIANSWLKHPNLKKLAHSAQIDNDSSDLNLKIIADSF